jgi:hypothetical protein
LILEKRAVTNGPGKSERTVETALGRDETGQRECAAITDHGRGELVHEFPVAQRALADCVRRTQLLDPIPLSGQVSVQGEADLCDAAGAPRVRVQSHRGQFGSPSI